MSDIAPGLTQWRGTKVVYWTGLENRRSERIREFESHPLL